MNKTQIRTSVQFRCSLGSLGFILKMSPRVSEYRDILLTVSEPTSEHVLVSQVGDEKSYRKLKFLRNKHPKNYSTLAKLHNSHRKAPFTLFKKNSVTNNPANKPAKPVKYQSQAGIDPPAEELRQLRSPHLDRLMGLTPIPEERDNLEILTESLQEDTLDAFATFWTTMREDMGNLLPARHIKLLENVVALVLTWRSCNDITGFLSSLVLFLNNHLESSSMSLIAVGLTKTFGSAVTYVGGVFVYDSQFGSSLDFSVFRKIFTNFSQAVNSELSTKIMSILSMVVTAGL